ncbi:hypothetical protein LTR47_004007 [Exophiala xenobiotica]|nr:hypothetical protein LTR47_004007 [Exophiala xenobiotica]KAK5254390.1 hypothetical protein LTS06_001224 [Exophiala xenobiotica]KAK5329577.1 hypothetical protein LTR93_001164 [Exophiala xenobiotica]KAK5346969.1 hypothetical protein LTR61_009410 [Exophiala xenobiotica]KAK5360818.1 hypothetical protein LTR11_010154 [Exophiala xenobiotica]
MYHGHTRVLQVSTSSGHVSSALVFRTLCCQSDISLSQALRHVRYQSTAVPRCSACRFDAGTHDLNRSPFRPLERRLLGVFGLSAAVEPSGRHRNIEHQHSQGYQPRRPFHTSSILSASRGKSIHIPAASLPSRTTASPLTNLPRPPRPEQSLAFDSKRYPRPPLAKATPALGNRKRAERPGDEKQSLPPNPAQEVKKKEELLQRRHQLRVNIQHASKLVENLDRELLNKAIIHTELLRTRKIAKEAHLDRAANQRAKLLVTPMIVQLESISRDAAVLEDAFADLRKEMQDYRRELRTEMDLTMNLMAHEKTETDGGGMLRKLARELDAASYIMRNEVMAEICSNLQERGLWKMPDRMLRIWREYSPKGATKPEVWRALMRILDLRTQYEILDADIQAEMHIYRALRRCSLRYGRHPEIYGYLILDFKFYDALTGIDRTSDGMIKLLRDTRWWAMTSLYGDLRVQFTDTWYHPRFALLVQKVVEGAARINSAYRGHLDQLTVLGVTSNVPLQLAQVSDFGPFVASIRGFSKVIRDADNLKDAIDLPLLLSGSDIEHRYLREGIVKWMMAAKDLRRILWKDIDTAIAWRGVANISFGIVSRPLNPSLLVVDTATRTLDMPRPDTSCLPATTWARRPWRWSPTLYPQGASIPISFVTTARGAAAVLYRLSKSKVLGVDIVVKGAQTERDASPREVDSAATRTTLFGLPFDLMVMASESEVAIFHLGYMDPADTLSQATFKSTLSNPSIMKVGVNMDFQKQMLAEHLGVELVELYDLQPKAPERGSLEDPNWSILSALMAQAFGITLPRVDLSRGHEAVFKDPPLFFNHLASRGYGALQWYYAACRASQMTTASSAAGQPQDPMPEFGPVSLDIPVERKGMRSVDLPALARKTYLQGLAKVMTRTMIEKGSSLGHLKRFSGPSRRAIEKGDIDLHCYLLFTSFCQDLKTIAIDLKVQNPAVNILAAVDRYHLPLLDDDRRILNAVRGFISAPLSNTKPIPSVRRPRITKELNAPSDTSDVSADSMTVVGKISMKSTTVKKALNVASKAASPKIATAKPATAKSTSPKPNPKPAARSTKKTLPGTVKYTPFGTQPGDEPPRPPKISSAPSKKKPPKTEQSQSFLSRSIDLEDNGSGPGDADVRTKRNAGRWKRLKSRPAAAGFRGCHRPIRTDMPDRTSEPGRVKEEVVTPGAWGVTFES